LSGDSMAAMGAAMGGGKDLEAIAAQFFGGGMDISQLKSMAQKGGLSLFAAGSAGLMAGNSPPSLARIVAPAQTESSLDPLAAMMGMGGAGDNAMMAAMMGMMGGGGMGGMGGMGSLGGGMGSLLASSSGMQGSFGGSSFSGGMGSDSDAMSLLSGSDISSYTRPTQTSFGFGIPSSVMGVYLDIGGLNLLNQLDFMSNPLFPSPSFLGF